MKRHRLVADLFSEYSRWYSMARKNSPTRECAEDGLSSAFEIALKKVPTDRAYSDVRAWFIVVLRRACWAMGKKEAPELQLSALFDESGAPLEFVSTEATPHERAERELQIRERIAGLARLKSAERQALIALGFGLSYAEIAAVKGWSRRKVERCIFEGRQSLMA